MMKQTIPYLLTAAAVCGFTSCSTTKAFDGENGQKVIEQFTGKSGSEWVVYVSQFEKEAKNQCPDGYKVVEKSYKPQALKCAHPLLRNTHFYWVIQCK